MYYINNGTRINITHCFFELSLEQNWIPCWMLCDPQARKTLQWEDIMRHCPRCHSVAKILSGQERGQCQNQRCQADFCTRCLASYHNSAPCPIITRRTRVEPTGSKKSKKNLRRISQLWWAPHYMWQPSPAQIMKFATAPKHSDQHVWFQSCWKPSGVWVESHKLDTKDPSVGSQAHTAMPNTPMVQFLKVATPLQALSVVRSRTVWNEPVFWAKCQDLTQQGSQQWKVSPRCCTGLSRDAAVPSRSKLPPPHGSEPECRARRRSRKADQSLHISSWDGISLRTGKRKSWMHISWDSDTAVNLTQHGEKGRLDIISWDQRHHTVVNSGSFSNL